MKNKRIVTAVVLTFILVSLGTAVAYMFRVSQQEKNSFIPAEVSCRIEEKFDGVNKTDIQIENTGNIPAYLRLRLVTYWVNTDDEGEEYIVAKPSSSLSSVQYDANNWIKGGNDTYYYKHPVNNSDGNSNQHFTQDLLTNPIILEKDEDGNRQVLDIIAEAIQANPEKAVESVWPVVVGADKTLTLK